jgi:regulator of protease activity HflC (stomatin/prohibitin superfamily)
MTVLLYVVLGVVGLLAIITFFMALFTVDQQTRAIVTRFGKFVRIAEPGLNFKAPWIDWVAGVVDMRVNPLEVEVETKTKDNVFVKIKVAVQYLVLPDKVYDAYYKLGDPSKQIESFVYDVVRAQVPKLDLDEVFVKKDDIADAVKSELAEAMDDYGYGIQKAPVTDIDPDSEVKKSMNEINAAQRQRVAANERGEADKILKVKQAEAEAQSKALQGKGIADQRKAIVEGLRESVSTFKESVQGSTAQDVMNLVLLTQYFDTMKEIGAQAKTNTVFMSSNPGALGEFMEQIRAAVIAGGRAAPNDADDMAEKIAAAAAAANKR